MTDKSLMELVEEACHLVGGGEYADLSVIRQRVAELELDAERYRFCRDVCHPALIVHQGRQVYWAKRGYGDTPEKAIDAAIAAERQEAGK